jgi:heme exporter protein A
MLSAHQLTCVRGDRPLFRGVELRVSAGEWLHVRGANGAGKTSLLRLLAGLSRPESGEVRWQGEPVARADQAYRRALMYLGHHAALKDDLSALENLQLAAALDGSALPEQEAMAALRRFGLQGREDLPVRFLSAGQKRRALLARLAARKAPLWILDEPFAALDAKAMDMLAELVAAHLANRGMAVITSHQALPLAAGASVQL